MTGTDDPPTRRRRDEEPGCDGGPGGEGCGPAGGADDSPTGETAEGGHVDESTEDEHADGGGCHAAEDGTDDQTTPGDAGQVPHHATDATDDPSDPSGGQGRPLPDQVRVEGGSPSDAVLRAVEAAAGVELAESEERLGEVVDVDALDALFRPTAESRGVAGRVEFSFCGCRVTVRSDGRVHATRNDAA